MSATNRGAIRHKDDFYETPAWCVRALLATVNLPGGAWFEPAVGDGAIVRAVNSERSDVMWTTNDRISRGFDAGVAGWQSTCEYTADGMFCPIKIGAARNSTFRVVITNPPFNQALEFVQGAMKDGEIVVMLLRLNWLASAKRNRFLLDNPPSVYVLPRRPSFTADGKTDATDYAWFVWGMDDVPTCRVIDSEVCK